MPKKCDSEYVITHVMHRKPSAYSEETFGTAMYDGHFEVMLESFWCHVWIIMGIM